jgi:Myb/SANT-like DNA-binding domain
MGSPRKRRSQWDDNKDRFVILYLLKAMRQGKKSDSGFKKDVWVELAKRFNTKFGAKPIMAYTQIQTRTHTVSLHLDEIIANCVS